jgi:hypothetical protein
LKWNLRFSQKNYYVRYQFFSLIVKVVARSVRKKRKKWGSSFKKAGDDVIGQNWMTSWTSKASWEIKIDLFQRFRQMSLVLKLLNLFHKYFPHCINKNIVIVHFSFFWNFPVFYGSTASGRPATSFSTTQTLCKWIFLAL